MRARRHGRGAARHAAVGVPAGVCGVQKRPDEAVVQQGGRQLRGNEAMVRRIQGGETGGCDNNDAESSRDTGQGVRPLQSLRTISRPPQRGHGHGHIRHCRPADNRSDRRGAREIRQGNTPARPGNVRGLLLRRPHHCNPRERRGFGKRDLRPVHDRRVRFGNVDPGDQDGREGVSGKGGEPSLQELHLFGALCGG